MLIVLRPEPGNAATLSAAHARGLPAIGAPSFRIESVPWIAPDASAHDALLLSSANAVRHAGPQLEQLRGLPVYAVGGATAQAAADAGFDVVRIGDKGLRDLAPRLAADGRMAPLRLAGEDRVELEGEEPGMAVIAVYRAVPLAMTNAVAATLGNAAIALLHSPAAARHFAAECDRLKIPRERVALASLSPQIGVAAGTGWRENRSSPRVDETALLALAEEMCQNAQVAPPDNVHD